MLTIISLNEYSFTVIKKIEDTHVVQQRNMDVDVDFNGGG